MDHSSTQINWRVQQVLHQQNKVSICACERLTDDSHLPQCFIAKSYKFNKYTYSSRDKKVLKCFNQEYKIMKNLNHSDYICVAFEYVVHNNNNDNNNDYLYNRSPLLTHSILLEQQDLNEWQNKCVNSGTVASMRTVQCVFKAMSSGLRDLHLLGYIHTDVKPENILVNVDVNNGYKITTCKLADFGGCMKYYDSTNDMPINVNANSFTAFTREYTAPEALRIVSDTNDDDDDADEKEKSSRDDTIVVEGPVNIKYDTFSIGCVLFFMVFNVDPFTVIKKDNKRGSRLDEQETYKNIKNNNYSIKDWFDPQNDKNLYSHKDKLFVEMLIDLIKLCLDPNPTNRPTSKELLKHDFFKLRFRRNKDCIKQRSKHSKQKSINNPTFFDTQSGSNQTNGNNNNNNKDNKIGNAQFDKSKSDLQSSIASSSSIVNNISSKSNSDSNNVKVDSDCDEYCTDSTSVQDRYWAYVYRYWEEDLHDN